MSFENVAIELITKEINLGRVAGPFTTSPLPNLRLSPIGLVPKRDGTLRLIHHLSGLSVTDLIDSYYCSVSNTYFKAALDMLGKLRRGL